MLWVQARRLVYQCCLAVVPVVVNVVVVVGVVFVDVVIVLGVDVDVAVVLVLVLVCIWDLIAADNQRKVALAEILTEVAAGRVACSLA